MLQLNKIIIKLKIWYYKSKLKTMYLNYIKDEDNYDCGSTLREYISGSKYKMNLIIGKLQDLGEPISKLT